MGLPSHAEGLLRTPFDVWRGPFPDGTPSPVGTSSHPKWLLWTHFAPRQAVSLMGHVLIQIDMTGQ